MPRELKSEEALLALVRQRVWDATSQHMPAQMRIVRTDLPGGDWNWMVLGVRVDRQVRDVINTLRGKFDLELPRSGPGSG